MVVEAAGSPATYRTAVDEVAFTGRVVCIGYSGEEVSFATRLFVQKEMDILGSRNATAEDFRNVVTYMGKGHFPAASLVSHEVNLAGAGQALQQWADDPGKVMKILLNLM